MVVVGLGYAGLPVALRAVEVGYRVVGLEADGRRVKRLLAGESHVEDIEAAQVMEALASGRFLPTEEADGAHGFHVAVIAVPTPLKEASPDLSHIETAVRALAPHVQPGSTFVVESTTYPGTTEELVAPILEDGSGLAAGLQFHLGYSPERIDPGNPEHGLANTL